MANTFNTLKNAPGVIAKAAAKILADELQFSKSIAQAPEDDYNGKNGYSAGDTIYISKPARFVPQNTFDITSTMQDITEEKTPLTLDVLSTVGVNIDSFEFATVFDLKNTINRIVKPGVLAIAQDVEAQFLVKAKNSVYNSVGTAGAGVFDPDTILSAREKMNKYLCPKDDNRFFLSDSTANRSAVGTRKGLFQSSSNIADQYKTGMVGTSDGFIWLENELLATHTRGTQVAGTATVTTTLSGEGVATMNVTGTSGGTLKKGDVFTIANVFAVHPQTKKVYPFLQQFVVTTENTASGTAYTGVTFSPAIYVASTGLKNVDTFPQGSAAITIVGTASTGYTQNLAFHREAFRMVSVPLIMPTAVEVAAQETVEGITVAVIRAFDVLKRRMVTRLDFLGGLATVRPEWACRITS